MATDFQGSFTGGELDPALSARVDLAKYGVGCATLKNFIVQSYGGVYRRPGLSFLLEALGATRLIPFQYNVEQTYVLAFSELKMRVLKDGGVVLNASTAITGATQANPVQVTSGTHGLVTGDDVFITDVTGMPELNGRFYAVTVLDVNTFTLDGIDSTGYTAYVSGGTVAGIYTETAPYAAADLNGLYVAQSADTMYICHSEYAPRKLTRTGHNVWTFTTLALGTSMTAPANGSARWDGQSLLESALDIVGATQTNPVQVTITGHGYSEHDTILIEDVWGMIELRGRTFDIDIIDINTVSLKEENGLGYAAYVSGGTSKRVLGIQLQYKVSSINASGEESLPSSAISVEGIPADAWVAGDHVHIDYDAAADAVEYYIYKDMNGLFGFIGATPGLVFRDDNFVPDLLFAPAEDYDPFAGGADTYPGTVSFYKQRLWFGGSNDLPQTLWASQVALFDNFNKSSPLKASDSLELTIASTQVNAIRWLTPFQDLLVGTSGAEWLVFSSEGSAITPSTTDTKVQSYWGSAPRKPIVVGDSILHVQEQGGKIRDLFFSLEKDGYSGNDLTVMVSHLFQGKNVVSWAYQRNPDSVLWCVMNDGNLYGLTYHKEHQVWGWHRHTTDGTFESVAVIPGAVYDDVYFVVKRTVQAQTVRYIEKMDDKWLLSEGVATAMLLDSALSYSGAAKTAFRGLDHLIGETVSALVDGSPAEGLTVDSDGVVTLSSDDGGTQALPTSIAYDTDWVLGAGTTIAQDQVGFGGEANTAWTITDTSSVQFGRISQAVAIADDNETHTLSVRIGKDDDETRFPEVQLALSNGTMARVSVQINTKTGASTVRLTAGTHSHTVESLNSDWWLVSLTVQNNTSGNTVANCYVSPAMATALGSIQISATGAIILDATPLVVHIGLPFSSTLAPMGVEELGGENRTVGRIKGMAKIIIRFAATVGGRVGPDTDYTFPLKFTPDTWGEAISPEETQDYEFIPPGDYRRDGSFFVIQDQPLPMTVLALIPEFAVGGM